MPWCAGNATTWPSTHAVHGELLGEIRDLETDLTAAEAGLRRIAASPFVLMIDEGDVAAERMAKIAQDTLDAMPER